MKILLQKIGARLIAVAIVVLLAACGEREAASPPPPKPYELGTVISFGKGGGSEAFRDGGWSETEAAFTWTLGPIARLAIPVAASARPLNLRMRLAGLIKPPEFPSQPVEVRVNGQSIATWAVVNTADFNATIPVEIAKTGGELNIELLIPKSTSPKALGLSTDPRVIGITCAELAISAAE